MDDDLQKLAQLREIADKEEDEPPKKKAKYVQAEEEVIIRAPQPLVQSENTIMTEANNSYITREIMSEKHSLAPQIPIISEIPLPIGYNPRREATDGITAGRSLVQLPDRINNIKGINTQHTSSQENKIAKLARENAAQFVAPIHYHRKKADIEWSDQTLADWNPSKYSYFFVIIIINQFK